MHLYLQHQELNVQAENSLVETVVASTLNYLVTAENTALTAATKRKGCAVSICQYLSFKE